VDSRSRLILFFSSALFISACHTTDRLSGKSGDDRIESLLKPNSVRIKPENGTLMIGHNYDVEWRTSGSPQVVLLKRDDGFRGYLCRSCSETLAWTAGDVLMPGAGTWEPFVVEPGRYRIEVYPATYSEGSGETPLAATPFFNLQN
jgi:hypothetical protein